MVVGTHQSFQFFRQPGFSEKNKSLHRFKQWILHNLISIIKLQNGQSVKPNSILTTRATLKFWNPVSKLAEQGELQNV